MIHRSGIVCYPKVFVSCLTERDFPESSMLSFHQQGTILDFNIFFAIFIRNWSDHFTWIPPAAITFSGISFVTTLPAPMMLFAPIVTP